MEAEFELRSSDLEVRAINGTSGRSDLFSGWWQVGLEPHSDYDLGFPQPGPHVAFRMGL